MNLALYQPEIPENTATLMRLAACLGIHLHLIEPLGFAFDTKKMRRIGMDYVAQVRLTRHVSFAHFQKTHPGQRLILATTKADKPHWQHSWQPTDILLMGQESAGAPDHIHEAAFERVTIPMSEEARSLNLATAATLICGEWQRQLASGGAL